MDLLPTVISIVLISLLLLIAIIYLVYSLNSMLGSFFALFIILFCVLALRMSYGNLQLYRSGELEITKYIDSKTANEIKRDEIEKILNSKDKIKDIYFAKEQKDNKYFFEVSYKYDEKDIHIKLDKNIVEEPELDKEIVKDIRDYLSNCELIKDNNTQKEENDILGIMKKNEKEICFDIKKGVLEDRVVYTLTFNNIIRDKIFVERKL